jgi:hypothetical protein
MRLGLLGLLKLIYLVLVPQGTIAWRLFWRGLPGIEPASWRSVLGAGLLVKKPAPSRDASNTNVTAGESRSSWTTHNAPARSREGIAS